jgi:CTP:molybdopterin cytidylyltransferase MocA
MPSIAIVPAAGKGERFGGGKLLTAVDGVPMIERTVRSLLDGGVASVVVVLAPDSDVAAAGPKIPALGDRRVRSVINSDPSRGMFSSIQAGLQTVVDRTNVILVLPADMPFVRAATVGAILTAARQSAEPMSPTYNGRRGHPLALPACLRAALLAVDPRESLNDALRVLTLPRQELPVDDPGILRDIDRRDDLGGVGPGSDQGQTGVRPSNHRLPSGKTHQ